MDTIRNYVDIMFKDLPKTKEIIDMKLNILDNMEDRYNELLQEGKTENEAIGTVISQFGNIDELKEELGITPMPEEQTEIMFKSEDEIMAYLDFKHHFSYMIALGVACCILAFIPPIFPLPGKLDIILFFMMIAFGVAILIIASMKNNDYTIFEKQPFEIDDSLREKLQQDYQRIKNNQSVGIAVGVVFCILAPMMYLLVENLMEWAFLSSDVSHHIMKDIIDGVASSSLFLCIAIAVFLFIIISIRKSAYDLVLSNQENIEYRKQEKKEDELYAIVMPIAAIIYLLMGFCLGWWHPGWLIFPIAAVFVMIINFFRKEEKEY